MSSAVPSTSANGCPAQTSPFPMHVMHVSSTIVRVYQGAIVALAMVFEAMRCDICGTDKTETVQVRGSLRVSTFMQTWFLDPRVLVSVIMFSCGMSHVAIQCHTGYTLSNITHGLPTSHVHRRTAASHHFICAKHNACRDENACSMGDLPKAPAHATEPAYSR